MRGMSGHTALATTQISIWDPKDPLRAGFLRTNFPSRVTDLPKFKVTILHRTVTAIAAVDAFLVRLRGPPRGAHGTRVWRRGTRHA